MNNLLLQCDNLHGLEYLLQDRNLRGKIDLCYIDPPYATGTNFTVTDGRASTVSKSKKGHTAYTDTLKGAEFIEFLRQRIALIHQLLSEQGSLYLHIDYKIGHYVKIMLDDVFGIDNFRNDITRIKCNPKNFDRLGYGNIKDMILFYTKSSHPIWNEPRKKYTEKDIEKLFPKKDKNGRCYTTTPIHAPGETENGKSNQRFKGMLPPAGRHWRTDVATLEQWDRNGLIEWSAAGNPRKIIYADEREGMRVQDIWEYKDPQEPAYPTEKNADMLNLIIATSSHKDSIVLDCFCGSGTTLRAAQLNHRRWIGIDQSDTAIRTAVAKLSAMQDNLFDKPVEYELLHEITAKTIRRGKHAVHLY
ncbi:MAG: site-specific DNA-methyltransferase [Planctomycetaceae bacterium]|jgi:adenine-specific DNA-methyltransferase|nr:site-specific DNA-methyltransferase [Planctomycetaceae bacterium]